MTDPHNNSGSDPDQLSRLRARVLDLEREIESSRGHANSRSRATVGHWAGLEGGLVGVGLLSRAGAVVEANDRLCGMLGYSRETLQGRAWGGLTNPDVRARDEREFERVASGEIDTGDLDTRLIRADGAVLHAAVSIRRGHDPHDDSSAFTVQVLDLTEQRNTAEQLRVSSGQLSALGQELQTLLDHTRDFVYRHNVEGVFDYLSPSIEQVTGYTREEWEKHYTAYLTDNPVNEAVVDVTEETIRTGKEGPTYLVEVRHRDGRPIMLEVNERPFFEDGNVAGIIGVARDVTERVKAEADIKRAKEAAEAASRAKSVFLANMSHELRTPLAAILGAAELRAGGRALSTDEEAQRDIILRNGRLLLTLLNDLLDVARVEAGRFGVHPVACVFAEIMADVEAAVRPQHRNSNVEFTIRYENPIPVRLVTDPTRLKQAIINLVNNALKFTEAGRVCVRIRADREDASPQLVIIVEDTGVGIPADALDEVFDTFSQLETTLGAVPGGTGLGLPVAKSIAEQLGGSLSVESRAGEGSAFALRLPLDAADAAFLEPKDMVLPVFATADHAFRGTAHRLSGHILLAEDFLDTRRMVSDALLDTGARVTSVADGRAAVQAASRQEFDLILLDIRMPIMDGREAACELRRRGCRAPMIALTASTEPSDRRTLLDAGFDDLWSKPISLASLLDRVGAYLQTEDPRRGDGRALPARSVSLNGERLMAAVAGFAHSLDERFRDIRAAIEDGMLSRAEDELHKLVGAAGIHGFMPLSRQAAALLAMTRNGTVTRTSPELDALRETIDAIPALDVPRSDPADS